jgi:hypothetical protein
MEQQESNEPTAESRGSQVVVPAHGGSATRSTSLTANAQAAQAFPPPPSYIYAIGKLEPRFPRLSVEKEMAQATKLIGAAGLTDKQALQRVLEQRQNRYLLRQLCWVMSIQGIDTYILAPRDPADADLLPQAAQADIVVVVGIRGPIANPDICNGLMVPIVAFDQIYWFRRDELVKEIPRPEKLNEEAFTQAAGELFDRVMQVTDNAGATDRDRALNFLSVRYDAIYGTVANQYAANASLTAIDVQASPLSGTRKLADVIFSFTDRQTDVVEKFFTRVDVTEEFPFLHTKLSPYYDR